MIKIVAAMDQAGGIGYGGRLLPWHVPGDLKRFRRLTEGKAVIMGRRTFEEIGRPLPNRTNIVVTRSTSISGIIRTGSVADAIKAVGGGDACVIGGTRIFEEALPYCTHATLTLVRGAFPSDTFFPVASFNRLTWEWLGTYGGVGGDLVVLKRVETTEHPFKLEI